MTGPKTPPGKPPRFPFDERDLGRFREVQQLAYACAGRVAEWLEPGVTERQAAGRLRHELVSAGVGDFFHVPFAWFGDRTAFRGFRTPLQFFPSARRLAEGMPFVLDCAPVVDGYTADIGYGGVVGENPIWERLDADLAEYRALIVGEVRARKPLNEVYAAVDALIARHGYDNRHRVYPGRVIGHQVTRLSPRGPAGATLFGFGVRTLQTLGRELISERLHGRSPLWADGRSSRHAPTPGLWAVEPHIGFRGVGLKFEELLVVTEDDAYWLDDDLPHVHRWRERSARAARSARSTPGAAAGPTPDTHEQETVTP
ncbi:M24 family metallopeptidase [Streptomyces sp. DSM 44917]|uniref:M24 family metallopeptidase n=2 Tax=Streptomyces boetiae TaxID=3075541 RepID=A0ABU2L2Y7_9ACTN|nr:M24 family metallopeptidase [Streptomyces sp. DSM 44917]MDT0305877.1 M24 family metallopeptidase [Streptomyces sp. DSM 44917]